MCAQLISFEVHYFGYLTENYFLKNKLRINVNNKLITIIEVIGKKIELCSFLICISPGNLPNQLINEGAKDRVIPAIKIKPPNIIRIFPISTATPHSKFNFVWSTDFNNLNISNFINCFRLVYIPQSFP